MYELTNMFILTFYFTISVWLAVTNVKHLPIESSPPAIHFFH